ncbi:hypothetical protein [Candidatus Synechococcus spongiarum]|uniref:hypothetical protein n=1 Tax=Candidatus Synechococcus spongiarum TaxID=431041 RepID=UPI002148CD12|nr:hypothetical protein [Candidatus Synechococcus spongiarum]
MRTAVERRWGDWPVQGWRQAQIVGWEAYQVPEAQPERPLALVVEPELVLELAPGQREVLEAPMGKPPEHPGQQRRLLSPVPGLEWKIRER